MTMTVSPCWSGSHSWGATLPVVRVIVNDGGMQFIIVNGAWLFAMINQS